MLRLLLFGLLGRAASAGAGEQTTVGQGKRLDSSECAVSRNRESSVSVKVRCPSAQGILCEVNAHYADAGEKSTLVQYIEFCGGCRDVDTKKQIAPNTQVPGSDYSTATM